MKNCPACNSKSLNEYYSIESLPLLLFPVDVYYKTRIEHDKLVSFFCEECCHIFTAPLSEKYANLIYGDYYRFYPYDNLESMNVYYRNPFEVFFEKTIQQLGDNITGKHLLEIGCSSGKQLEFYDRFKLNCNGIDPSPLNISGNERIISGFYQDYKLNSKFDIIVARFVLEHISDLKLFLEKVGGDLNDEGTVFFQVPNVMEFINNSIPSFLAHEHSQYFNAYAITKMAERNNFKVVGIHHENSQSICVALKSEKSKTAETIAVKKPNVEKFNEFIIKRESYKNSITELLRNYTGKVCFYGSGLMLTWLLYDLNSINENNAGVVIDDNSKLEDKYLPQSNFVIKKYSKEIVSKYELILLTLNPIYHKDVVTKLKKDNFKGEIYSLSKDGVKKVI